MRIAALLLALWPCVVDAAVFDDKLSPETFGSIEVIISDGAKMVAGPIWAKQRLMQRTNWLLLAIRLKKGNSVFSELIYSPSAIPKVYAMVE